MTTLLRLIQSVRCPDQDSDLVGVGRCEGCPNLVELRRARIAIVRLCS